MTIRARIGEWLTRRLILKPIFVVGIGRSGTSVLLQAIAAHPQVVPAEGEAPLVRSFGALVNQIEFSDERGYYERTLFLPKQELYRGLRRLCFETVVGPDYGWSRTVRGPRRRDVPILHQTHWCAKVGVETGEYRGLRHLYPGARLVYIVRNGIEVVHSRTQFPGFKHLSFESHCRTWALSCESYSYLSEAANAIQVRHEQLVADPEQVLHRVFELAELPPHSAPVHLVRSTLMIPLDEPTRRRVDVRAVFEQRRPAWEAWSDEQRETFRAIAGSGMRRLGYEIPF
jgi:Sulfotransferase family